MKTIHLTNGDVTRVDDEYFEQLNRVQWYCHIDSKTGTKYARRIVVEGDRRVVIWMHGLVMGKMRGTRSQVDHRDNDGLNNQKQNLRLCSPRQNQGNRRAQKHSSPYKGVSMHSPNGPKPWLATIWNGEKHCYLGLHTDPCDAARAYDVAALKHFGEFARTNQQMGLL